MATPVRAVLTGMGVALPRKVMTNADFEKFLDTIRDKYTIPQPGLVITHSKTMDFLMEYLDEKN